VANTEQATTAKAIEPFFTTKGPGMVSGLGLSVVQGIAAQSGGRLRIDSTPNVGTTVQLWLPQSNTHPMLVGRTVGTTKFAPTEAAADNS
jgi:signal transduction histidine kinase